jgi:hypothetical protein
MTLINLYSIHPSLSLYHHNKRSSVFTIIIRTMKSGKDIGHVNKVLDSLTKANTPHPPTSSSSSSTLKDQATKASSLQNQSNTNSNTNNNTKNLPQKSNTTNSNNSDIKPIPPLGSNNPTSQFQSNLIINNPISKDTIVKYDKLISSQNQNLSFKPYVPTSDNSNNITSKATKGITHINTFENNSSNSSSSIPNPPPMPLPKAKSTNSHWVQDSNGKWIKIPIPLSNNNTKPIEDLKSISGKPYSTSITESCKASDINDQDLINELSKRELINEDTTPLVSVKLQTGEDHILKNKGIKFSQLGQAYYSDIENKKDITLLPNTNSTTEIEFQIIVGPTNANTFIESGKQKHMLAAYDKNTQEYHILGYFTSKKTADFFSKEQFKVFQAKLQDSTSNTENVSVNKDKPFSESENKVIKSQHFLAFKNAESIPSSQVKLVKGGEEYIKASNQQKYLKLLFEKLEEKPYKEFITSHISKQDCINMCLRHDQNIKNKKTHPLTEDQIKLNLENSAKIKADNEAKKNAKLLEKQNENEPKESL